MTQNYPENIANFEFSKSEALQSIHTLINLIPDPAIIYHQDNDLIIAANNPLFLISSLGEIDFIGKSIKILLPNLTDSDPISGHGKKAFLKHRNQTLIPITVRIFSLIQSRNVLLIILKPDEFILTPKQMVAEKKAFLDGLLSILQSRSKSDIKSILGEVLIHASKLLKAELVCIYKASGSKPELTEYLANNADLASELPHTFMIDEVGTSQQPSCWVSDQPSKNQLELYAANANYKFLITVPLGQVNSKFGLFVAAGREPYQKPENLTLAKLIATYLSGMMEDQITLHNLRNLTTKIKQVVKIQNEVLANVDIGVIILSPDLTIAEINPAAETILGYANVEALRQKIDSILIGSESLGSAFTNAQQGIPTFTGGDLTLHHRNGNAFPAQVMMTPVTDQGQILAIITLIRDMSQQAQSQAVNKQLEQRAILGEVTAIFAHEVRNPINAIMLSLQVIEENLAEGDKNLKWIDNMRDECNKLLHLMESVLSFAKPLEYKMSGVDLNFLIPRILERWHPRLVRLNIASYYESDVENPIIEGDLRALEQVFTNLISNSVNAMSDKGGSLTIKVSDTDLVEDQKFFLVTVSDTGPGIPDEIKNRMFKPFVTGTHHGTGLGLAITQRIINAHKGKIEVESFTGGTIFRIFLMKKRGLSV